MRREYRLGVGGGGEAESTWAPLQRWSRSAGLGTRKPRLSEPIRQAWWSNLLWIMAVRKPSAATKKVLRFDPDQTFEVSDEVIGHTRKLVDRGREAHQKWQSTFDAWAERGALVDGPQALL